MKRLMIGVLAGGLVGLTGCESCDFSFGPVPVTVRVTPEDVDAAVVICDGEGRDVRCQTLSPSDPDTGFGADTGLPPGTVTTTVSWDGYAVCRYPALDVIVTAAGCEPVHLFVPHQGRGAGIQLDIALDCDEAR